MTIEEKAEAYDEALERAKKLQETCDSTAVVGWCEYIFPELKELDGERTRKAILTGLMDCRDAPDLGWSDFGGINIDECIAWIEKQCEQTHAELGKSEVTKTSDKELEPKFNVGDWIVTDDSFGKIVRHVDEISFNIIDKGYVLSDENGLFYNLSFDKEHKWHKWTIQDAEDGGVLASELTDSIFLFRGIKDNKIDFYCDYDAGLESPYDRFGINDSSEHYGSVEESQDIHPATKEQRDTLIKAMANAGYTFDFEKKELKKIEPKKLDPDKVIEWMKNMFSASDMVIDKFKKDFKL